MKKLNFSWLQKAINASLTFGSKNAPTLITGGSIILGWTAVYVFWKESKNAEKEIQREEEKLLIQREEGEDVPAELPVKEKVIIYLKYCWLAAALGLGSTVGTVVAHKMELSRILEMYALTQFLEDKSNKQGKMIDKLKGEVKEKKVQSIKDDILNEEYPKEEVMKTLQATSGDATTLFIDKVTHARFRGDIVEVTSGINEVNALLKKRRIQEIKKRYLKDPFFAASDFPFGGDEIDPEDKKFGDVYSTVSLDILLDAIGETKNDNIETRLDELLEFRYYGGGDLLKPKDILIYKQYEDPASGIPAVCFIDYTELLSPAYELMERNPL